MSEVASKLKPPQGLKAAYLTTLAWLIPRLFLSLPSGCLHRRSVLQSGAWLVLSVRRILALGLFLSACPACLQSQSLPAHLSQHLSAWLVTVWPVPSDLLPPVFLQGVSAYHLSCLACSLSPLTLVLGCPCMLPSRLACRRLGFCSISSRPSTPSPPVLPSYRLSPPVCDSPDTTSLACWQPCDPDTTSFAGWQPLRPRNYQSCWLATPTTPTPTSLVAWSDRQLHRLFRLTAGSPPGHLLVLGPSQAAI